MFTFADPRTDSLARALREHPEGLTFIQIAARLTPVPPLRTLQRWLGRLVFAGLVTRRGRTNRVRYFAGKGRAALPVGKRRTKPPPTRVREPEPAPPPSPPPSAPEPSRLPPEFQPVFDGVAPKIIRMGYVDDVAISELARAAVAGLHADTDLMDEFVAAAMPELDALDRDTAMAKYHVRPADWDYWRTKWCSLRDLPG